MEQISKYFNAEKSESLLFILVGVAAILLSAYFFVKIKQPFYSRMAKKGKILSGRNPQTLDYQTDSQAFWR
jgi:hypothetical protein